MDGTSVHFTFQFNSASWSFVSGNEGGGADVIRHGKMKSSVFFFSLKKTDV